MKQPYLLDTHTLLWWLDGDEKLSAKARGIISDPERVIYFSAASAWEISTKFRIGKLNNAAIVAENLTKYISEQSFKSLPISIEHALVAGSLKHKHRDPFDRMLAAQSKIEEMIVISNDKQIKNLGGKLIW